MRILCTAGALVLLASGLQSAQIWTGQLFDSVCIENHKEIAKYDECMPTKDTASFDLQVSGQMLKLDAQGDRKAAAAWKDYLDTADRIIDPDLNTKPVTAVIEGTVTGDELKVDSILLR